MARITGSDPVHARSNRALAAKFKGEPITSAEIARAIGEGPAAPLSGIAVPSNEGGRRV